MDLVKLVSIVLSISAIAMPSNPAVAANTQTNDVGRENIGKIPTFHYSISAEYMMDLLMMDIRDRRQHNSKSKPSYLDAHIVRTENVADGISGGGFANNSGQLCATIVYIYVSSENSSNQGQSSMATRNCAMPGGTELWSQWARNTSGILNTLPGLSKLYKNYDVTTGNTTNNYMLFRTQPFRPAAKGTQEIWGQTYFNGYGNNALAQELVVTVANWY